jgi:hypothetical protein
MFYHIQLNWHCHWRPPAKGTRVTQTTYLAHSIICIVIFLAANYLKFLLNQRNPFDLHQLHIKHYQSTKSKQHRIGKTFPKPGIADTRNWKVPKVDPALIDPILRSPYAISGGITNFLFSPTHILQSVHLNNWKGEGGYSRSPWSHPLMTCPAPSLNSNGLPLKLIAIVKGDTDRKRSRRLRRWTRVCRYD